MSDSIGLFSEMSSANKIALITFVLSKIFGITGFSLGFFSGFYRQLGGCVLGLSFIMILLSIGFSIYQSLKDQKKFESEDTEKSLVRALTLKKEQLEREIKELEMQKMHDLTLQIKLEKSRLSNP